MASTRMVPCDIYPKTHRARREDEECCECEPGSYWLERAFEPPSNWRPDNTVWGYSYGWRDPQNNFVSDDSARKNYPQYVVKRYRPTLSALDAARARAAKRAAEEKARLLGRAVPPPPTPPAAPSTTSDPNKTPPLIGLYPQVKALDPLGKIRARAQRVLAIRQWMGKVAPTWDVSRTDSEIEKLDRQSPRWAYQRPGDPPALPPRPAELD